MAFLEVLLALFVGALIVTFFAFVWKKFLLVGLLAAFLVGCAPVDQAKAGLSGDPSDHNMGNSVHCYTYTQGSISCIQVK